MVLSGITRKVSIPLATPLGSSLVQNRVHYQGLTLPFLQPNSYLILDLMLLLMQPKLALPSLTLWLLGP